MIFTLFFCGRHASKKIQIQVFKKIVTCNMEIWIVRLLFFLVWGWRSFVLLAIARLFIYTTGNGNISHQTGSSKKIIDSSMPIGWGYVSSVEGSAMKLESEKLIFQIASDRLGEVTTSQEVFRLEMSCLVGVASASKMRPFKDPILRPPNMIFPLAIFEQAFKSKHMAMT